MKKLDFKTIRKKIFQFCAYQERSTHEVKQKLQAFSLTQEEIESIINELKENHFLNDERYVKSFVRGKFRNCHWGKTKIAFKLQNQNFDNHIIQVGLDEIQKDEYFDTLYKLASQKLQSLQNDPQKVLKTRRYLYQKGFEEEWIDKVLENFTH